MDAITKAQYALAKKAQAQYGIPTMESRVLGNSHARFGATV
jgi:hypothetical protein